MTDTEMLDWLQDQGAVVAGDLLPLSLCREAPFGWTAKPLFGDAPRTLRQAIESAARKPEKP